MKVTVNKQEVKTGWDGPGFYVVADDPDCKALWYFADLTSHYSMLHQESHEMGAAGVCIVDRNGEPGEKFLRSYNVKIMRKLGPGETITIEP